MRIVCHYNALSSIVMTKCDGGQNFQGTLQPESGRSHQSILPGLEDPLPKLLDRHNDNYGSVAVRS